jgi:hypothetical protein
MTRPRGGRKSADFVQPLDDLFLLHFDGQFAAIVEATGREIDRADNRLESVSG